MSEKKGEKYLNKERGIPKALKNQENLENPRICLFFPSLFSLVTLSFFFSLLFGTHKQHLKHHGASECIFYAFLLNFALFCLFLSFTLSSEHYLFSSVSWWSSLPLPMLVLAGRYVPPSFLPFIFVHILF